MSVNAGARMVIVIRCSLVTTGLIASVLCSAATCWPAENSGAESAGNAAKETAPVEASAAPAAVSWFQQLDLQALWLENTWQDWAILAAAVFVGILLGRLLAIVIHRLADRLANRGWHAQAHFVDSSAAPISLILITLGLWIGLAGLKMSQPMQIFCQKTLLMLYTIAAVMYGWNLAALMDVVVVRLTHGPESLVERQLLPILRKTVRVLLLVLAALFLLESVFQQNIGAWLAGLGIAGLAVSLAAQDSLKNLFGSLTILLDRPFCVGDRISTSGYEGTVEEIGFRSTRIRTLNDTVVTIPNANIVNSPVENISRRRFIRRMWTITLPGDLPAEKVQQAVEIVRRALEEPGIREPITTVVGDRPLSPQVYCSDLTPGQTVVTIVYCHAPADFAAFSQHAERVNLRIAAALQEAQIPFNPLFLRYRAD